MRMVAPLVWNTWLRCNRRYYASRNESHTCCSQVVPAPLAYGIVPVMSTAW